MSWVKKNVLGTVKLEKDEEPVYKPQDDLCPEFSHGWPRHRSVG